MYLDSAILVKLVVREPDREYYADFVDGQSAVFSSELTIVECRSALLRKQAQGQLAARTCSGAWARLQALWSGGGLVLYPVSLAVLQEAGETIQRCTGHAPLRTLDAIHIATCLRSRAYPLVTNDGVMRAAAEILGVPLSQMPD